MKYIWLDTKKLEYKPISFDADHYIGPAIELDQETLMTLKKLSMYENIKTIFIKKVCNHYVEVIEIYNDNNFYPYRWALTSSIAETITDMLEKIK